MGLKVYLTISVGVLMIITSAGIYGFLSNAYQKTANKLEIHEGELGSLDVKKVMFEKSISDNQKIIDSKNKRSDKLSELRGQQEIRLDAAKTNAERNRTRSDIASANAEIQKLTNEIDVINAKNVVLSDSVNIYVSKGLTLTANSDVAGEVGPLKYISQLTNTPMDVVVNYLILLVIFVFDPLAIALILITNKVFELDGGKNPIEPKPKPNNVIPTDKIWKGVKEQREKGNLPTLTEEDFVEPTALANSQYVEAMEEPIMVDEQFDDVVNDAVNDAVNEPIEEVIEDVIEEEVVIEDNFNETPMVFEEIVEEPETTVVSESKIEVPVYKKEPVITTGKIEVEDIKEIKEGNRGYSVPVPQPKNTVERIGSNKITKNGDNNTVFFKRG